MERILVGSTAFTWDPTTRIAAFRQGPHADGELAKVLVARLSGWVGPGDVPFAVLVDATDVRGTDAGWRTTWAGFFREQRGRGALAIFGANPAIRIVIDLFRIGTGVQVKAFGTEEAARAWLAERGVPA